MNNRDAYSSRTCASSMLVSVNNDLAMKRFPCPTFSSLSSNVPTVLRAVSELHQAVLCDAVYSDAQTSVWAENNNYLTLSICWNATYKFADLRRILSGEMLRYSNSTSLDWHDL